MDYIIKTVKQYSYDLEADSLKEFLFISNQYKNLKNYVYSRFSGIKNVLLINTPRNIRDKWVKSKFYTQWKLPARYWKLALSEAVSNIKSNWSNVKRKIKITIKENFNLNNEDKHYIRYILKSDFLYYKILNRKEYIIPKKFKNLDLNFKYLNNLIRRYTRKYKGSIPYSKKGISFSIDTGLYRYENGTINISSTNKGKRIKVELRDRRKFNSTLLVKLNNNNLQIHIPLKIKKKNHSDYLNILGLDKGYKSLLAVSNGNLYGENLNRFLNIETERLNKVNSNRNRFWALYKNHLETNARKAENILENNLGKVKYIKNKNKHMEKVKSYINYSINNFLLKEKPKEVVMENLDFVSWDNRYTKSVKRKLSRWIKGYIRERLEYKFDYNNILYTYVNPAYTSKVCNCCGRFGERIRDMFTCKTCGHFHADINASKNILNRKDDKEISLYTNFKKVKEILKNRV